jgi:tRNA threonylcarbamoyladenosine biosynthesis protein TsaB
MKILAVEASTKIGSVAILDGDTILIENILDASLRHSEKLMPALDASLKEVNLGLEHIDVFACGVGPGSFTGLRVGLAMMKGIAFATGKPLLGVSSLDTLAMNARTGTVPEKGDSPLYVVPMIDAFRSEVYTSLFKNKKRIIDEQAINPKEWLKYIVGASPRACPNDLGRYGNLPLHFVGDGAIKYKTEINTIIGEQASFAEDHTIHASHMAYLAADQFGRGTRIDLDKLSLKYIRAGVG